MIFSSLTKASPKKEVVKQTLPDSQWVRRSARQQDQQIKKLHLNESETTSRDDMNGFHGNGGPIKDGLVSRSGQVAKEMITREPVAMEISRKKPGLEDNIFDIMTMTNHSDMSPERECVNGAGDFIMTSTETVDGTVEIGCYGDWKTNNDDMVTKRSNEESPYEISNVNGGVETEKTTGENMRRPRRKINTLSSVRGTVHPRPYLAFTQNGSESEPSPDPEQIIDRSLLEAIDQSQKVIVEKVPEYDSSCETGIDQSLLEAVDQSIKLLQSDGQTFVEIPQNGVQHDMDQSNCSADFDESGFTDYENEVEIDQSDYSDEDEIIVDTTPVKSFENSAKSKKSAANKLKEVMALNKGLQQIIAFMHNYAANPKGSLGNTLSNQTVFTGREKWMTKPQKDRKYRPGLAKKRTQSLTYPSVGNVKERYQGNQSLKATVKALSEKLSGKRDRLNTWPSPLSSGGRKRRGSAEVVRSRKNSTAGLEQNYEQFDIGASPDDDDRRIQHNFLEQRRRSKMATDFRQLQAVIPHIAQEKVAKIAILNHATQYISHLQARERELEMEKEYQLQRRESMEAKYCHLQEMEFLLSETKEMEQIEVQTIHHDICDVKNIGNGNTGENVSLKTENIENTEENVVDVVEVRIVTSDSELD